MTLTPVIQYDPPSHESSAAELLHALWPRSESLTWLRVYWQAGDLWDPLERWVIYQMVPPALITVDQWYALSEGDPRERGHYDRVLRQFVSDAMLTREQWDLWQQTGCYARRYWIVEGHAGGHKVRPSPAERKRAKFHKLEWPNPGDQSFAPVTHQTVYALLERDRLEQHLNWLKRRPADEWKDREGEDQRFRAELLNWMDNQIFGVVRDIPKKALHDWVGSIPRGDESPDNDLDEATERFVMEG